MARVVMNRNLKRDYHRPENHRGWVIHAGIVGKRALQIHAPKRTTFLAASVRTRVIPGPHGPIVRYELPAPYATFPDVGTGLYGPLRRWITPTRAKALSWINTSGRRVFATRVRGQRPTRYVKKAMEDTFGRRNVRYYGYTGGRR